MTDSEQPPLRRISRWKYDSGFRLISYWKRLSLHGLELFPMLGVRLKSTNCLEQLGQLTDKMDHWRTSDQRLSEARDHRANVLAVEERIRRTARGSSEAAEGIGAGESAPQADCRRPSA